MENRLIKLIQKYETNGPRYTSYPPAPIFKPDFTAAQYQSEILQVEKRSEGDDVSLYFHIPFCDTLCYFCGCTTMITKNREHLDEYLVHLKKEIDLLAPLFHQQRKIVQLHWGGGTPTYLSPKQIQELGTHIMKSFQYDVDAEISVEVDPRELTFSHLHALRDVGFNRISLGVQDFNPNVQRAVNRNQSEFITRQAITWSRELGFSSLNVDLIYGLPLQTVVSFSETLDKLIEISPERIAVYNFAFVPWMKKQQKLIHVEDLPSPETKLGILTTTIDKLTDAGYVYIGMDHFAKPDDELTLAQQSKTLRRNFQGYSTRAGSDLYGLGMSSISHFGTSYAQNAKTLPEYYQAISNGEFATHLGYKMTKDDEIRKHVIMKLMCDLSLQKSEVESQFGISFDAYFSSSLTKLDSLIEDGLLVATPDSLIITNDGRLFLRNIAMCFDAYLSEKSKQQPLYSKTV
ncbi:MAG: oxygen-independent coproporphyrinogen III oxidase [Ignavibacteriales bacterium]|nr:oxygen-independent coproporphyrinogen III oxidase [Ignavibacteriales bacterium]